MACRRFILIVCNVERFTHCPFLLDIEPAKLFAEISRMKCLQFFTMLPSYEVPWAMMQNGEELLQSRPVEVLCF